MCVICLIYLYVIQYYTQSPEKEQRTSIGEVKARSFCETCIQTACTSFLQANYAILFTEILGIDSLLDVCDAKLKGMIR